MLADFCVGLGSLALVGRPFCIATSLRALSATVWRGGESDSSFMFRAPVVDDRRGKYRRLEALTTTVQPCYPTTFIAAAWRAVLRRQEVQEKSG
jgi:hypothetical protein